jgi:hypothetical protein
MGSDRLMLAVGDISGKGISAALLMATVHAFVRAYSLAPGMELTSGDAGSWRSHGSIADRRIISREDGRSYQSRPSHRHVDGHLEPSAFSLHRAGEVRDHVSGLL